MCGGCNESGKLCPRRRDSSAICSCRIDRTTDCVRHTFEIKALVVVVSVVSVVRVVKVRRRSHLTPVSPPRYMADIAI